MQFKNSYLSKFFRLLCSFFSLMEGSPTLSMFVEEVPSATVLHNHFSRNVTAQDRTFLHWVFLLFNFKLKLESSIFVLITVSQRVALVWTFAWQSWSEKLLSLIAPSPFSISFLQMGLCSSPEGNGMSKVAEIVWMKKQNKKKQNTKKLLQKLFFFPPKKMFM